VRRLLAWFDRRFTDEVNAVLLHERMEKPLLRLGRPRPAPCAPDARR
jgi:glutathione S-transferase